MQLKALIKKKAAEKNIRAQLVMQTYMLERLLKRISISRHKDNFILKGGFLISAIVGLHSRATKDLDTTLKGMELTHSVVRAVFEDVCTLYVDDNLRYELVAVEDIRETDSYPGVRAKFNGIYETLRVPLFIDITTGDKITPKAIRFEIPSMFDEEKIEVFAYNFETLLAEKIETILSRGIANTRPRDFYDVFILVRLHKADLDFELLKRAVIATAEKRNTIQVYSNYEEIVDAVSKDQRMINFWERYKVEFDYAKNIDFNDICKTIVDLLKKLDV
jgi:predicted nucleotidyltransferase component of viral defense system